VNEQRCSYCHGEGRYASLLTNWDSVPCDRCRGTGQVAVAPKPRRPIAIEAPAAAMRVQLAALKVAGR
jgi:DnaJ-class molecular chaperone